MLPSTTSLGDIVAIPFDSNAISLCMTGIVDLEVDQLCTPVLTPNIKCVFVGTPFETVRIAVLLLSDSTPGSSLTPLDFVTSLD